MMYVVPQSTEMSVYAAKEGKMEDLVYKSTFQSATSKLLSCHNPAERCIDLLVENMESIKLVLL